MHERQRPESTNSPVIEDRSLYWQFQFMNLPIEVNVDNIIKRSSEYLRALNSVIFQNTGDIKRRGRYTNFEIAVRAEAADGLASRWVANCKARNSGEVESLELVQVDGNVGAQVARSDN